MYSTTKFCGTVNKALISVDLATCPSCPKLPETVCLFTHTATTGQPQTSKREGPPMLSRLSLNQRLMSTLCPDKGILSVQRKHVESPSERHSQDAGKGKFKGVRQALTSGAAKHLMKR